MRETLLLIDGRGQPAGLVKEFEKAGFFCVYARGPLKVKTLLREHPVALVIWKDNTGNLELGRDLARTWKAYASVPVLHLYAREPHANAAEFGPQVRASLPAETPEGQILAVVEEILNAQKPAPPSELQVIGAAGRAAGSSVVGEMTSAKIETPPTGLTNDERTTLFAASPANSIHASQSPWQRLWKLLTRPA